MSLFFIFKSDCEEPENYSDVIDEISDTSISEDISALDSELSEPECTSLMQENVDSTNTVMGKDGTVWCRYSHQALPRGRLRQLNIMRVNPGPTAFATSRIIKGSPIVHGGPC